jgi:hypothetical protein
MQQWIVIKRGGRALAAAFSLATAVALVACSDDDTQAAEDAGQDTAAPVDAGCVPFEGELPAFLEALDPCPEAICESGGRCVPNNLLGGAGGTDFLAPCNDTSTCVPEEFVAAEGEAVPFPCTSVAGAEGRCLSKCLPSVSSQESVLPQDTCGPDHLCVPCFEPLSGSPTGACTLSCDMPQEDPLTFEACCDDLGSCVPSGLVPSAFRDNLPDCGDDDGLCVPNKFIEDSGYTPATCDAAVGEDSLGEGACLALCLALEGDPDAADLAQDVCDAGEVCVPCEDPESGLSTGACEIGGGDDPPDGGVGDAGVDDGGVSGDGGLDGGV